MKRTALLRKTPLAQGGASLRRSAIARGASTLGRSAPMRRGVPIKKCRETTRRSSYFEDRGYLDFLRGEQGCQIAAELDTDPRDCWERIDPDHLRAGAGGGQTAPDPMAYSACRLHHTHQHGGNGVFKGWGRRRIDALCAKLAAIAQARYYGRAVTAADLPTIRAATEAGQPTRGLFAAANDHRADRDHPPGQSVPRSRASARGHLSTALELLLPQPGVITVGSPVTLGTREGTVAELFPAVRRMAVRWLDGSLTEEDVP